MKSFTTFLKNQSLYLYVLILVIASLSLSLFLFVSNQREFIDPVLKGTLIIGSIPLWYSLLRDLLRGSFGVDVIAGVALVGTFAIGQYVAGVVVLLMLSGGQLFEVYAMRRARRELSSLLSKTPTFAHVKIGDRIVETPINKVTVGMLVIIKPGETVSVDGVVVEGKTTIDESTLTGESMPVLKQSGASVYAGTENIDDVIVVGVEKPAHETRYQSIIKLVKKAEDSKAPLVRLADTYSLYFTGITFIIALLAWFLSHDLVRVVAVLVVATPCPLLLATPIAIMSGMSKASTRGIIVKDGGALETLARVTTFVFDKTGTITLGTPEVSSVVSFGAVSEESILITASSLDQLSTHVLSRALMSNAKESHLTLSYPDHFREEFGEGTSGMIDGTLYFFGKKTFIEEKTKQTHSKSEELYTTASKEGKIAVFLANEHEVLGAILFQDILREDTGLLFKNIHTEGIAKTIILTGDTKERGDATAKLLRVTDVVSDCLPGDKVRYIEEFQNKGDCVAMVGDGVNDAPALAKADVGIALGTHGQTASSDVADIVVLSGSVGRVYDALHIAKKTIYLARQGIILGIGASTLAMIWSALGHIPPLQGVILQEGIDVIVIVNALRLGSTIKL